MPMPAATRLITAFGLFLVFAAAMALFAAFLMLWPGTVLDNAWGLNPTAHRQLALVGRPAGILFLALSGALAAAGIGWFKRHRWGWLLAVIIMATQLVGDLGNMLWGDPLKGAVGMVIAGALLACLLSRRVRAQFSASPQ